MCVWRLARWVAGVMLRHDAVDITRWQAEWKARQVLTRQDATATLAWKLVPTVQALRAHFSKQETRAPMGPAITTHLVGIDGVVHQGPEDACNIQGSHHIPVTVPVHRRPAHHGSPIEGEAKEELIMEGGWVVGGCGDASAQGGQRPAPLHLRACEG